MRPGRFYPPLTKEQLEKLQAECEKHSELAAICKPLMWEVARQRHLILSTAKDLYKVMSGKSRDSAGTMRMMMDRLEREPVAQESGIEPAPTIFQERQRAQNEKIAKERAEKAKDLPPGVRMPGAVNKPMGFDPADDDNLD